MSDHSATTPETTATAGPPALAGSTARPRTKCCGSAKLELTYRTYDDGKESWGYSCACGKVMKRERLFGTGAP